MTREALIEEIGSLMKLHLNVAHDTRLDATTRLNQDVYLDSVMVLELLVLLETKLGFVIPEEAPAREHFLTLGALAEFLLGLSHDARQAS